MVYYEIKSLLRSLIMDFKYFLFLN